MDALGVSSRPRAAADSPLANDPSPIRYGRREPAITGIVLSARRTTSLPTHQPVSGLVHMEVAPANVGNYPRRRTGLLARRFACVRKLVCSDDHNRSPHWVPDLTVIYSGSTVRNSR